MKQREAVGPYARAALLPYRFLVFLAPLVAEGVYTRLAVHTGQPEQPELPELPEEPEEPVRVQEPLTVTLAKGFLRANTSTDSTDEFLVGDLSDLREDLPEGLPEDQLAATQAAHTERLQAENIANDLKDNLLRLAKGGAPIPPEFLKQVSDLVEKVLKPSALKHHDEDVALLKHLMDDFTFCDRSRGQENDRATEADRVRSIKSQEHRQCREDEEDFASDRKACHKTLRLTTAVKENVCKVIEESRVGPADQQATCVDRFCHYLPGENYEMYLRRISAYFQTKLEEFERAKGACEEMSKQADVERAQCERKDSAHKSKRSECNGVQEQLERAACVTANQKANSCDIYGACYERASAAYKKLRPVIEQREKDRKAEWKAIKQIECLLGALQDGAVSQTEIDTCMKKEIDYTHLTLTFQDAPSKAKCTGSKDGAMEGPTVPCSGEYMKTQYGSLPKQAPAKSCTPCAGPAPEVKKGVPSKCAPVSCDWTLQRSCPGQPLGSKGPATTRDGGENGYECCCKYGLWKKVKRKTATQKARAVPIVTVAKGGGSTPLGTRFWAQECVKIPSNAIAIQVTMGDVVDYFKPAGHNSYCAMLTSGRKHLWSKDGVNWMKPGYHPSIYRLGGSEENWPKLRVSDDYRQHLTFWGDSTHKGGCCSTSRTTPFEGWGQGFTMAYIPPMGTVVSPTSSNQKPLYPLKVQTKATTTAPPAAVKVVKPLKAAAVTQGCGPVMQSDAYGGPYDESYWQQKCLEIPATAKSIRITMGEWTDYFKPLGQTTTMCEMLISHNMHMWSPDGVSWKAPTFYPSGSFLGGSQMEWPASQGINPKRRYVSFWGHSWQRGGCCTSRKDQDYMGWSQYFTMEYCV